jgi:glycosyltransferase involved in cell wall biosynthesis
VTSGKPSVSVVLVTYNRASLLDSTIASIVKQTMADFELIIADDASPDHTGDICRRWGLLDNRIRYDRRPNNVGMPQNLNLGVLASVGPYVAILHDDDVYSPTLLEEWKGCLDESPKAAFVFNAYQALDDRDQPHTLFREPLARCSPGSIILERLFFRRWRFSSPVFGTVMMRRSAFDHAGPFDERYGFWADVDMWMRLAEDFEVGYVGEPLIAVRSRAVSPHQFADSFGSVQPMRERMFWEARMRHYHERPLRRSVEAIRHWGFIATARAWELACWAKHGARWLARSAPIRL